jgi:hypothetical protein
MSRSVLENQQSQPSLLVESIEMQGVHISGDPSFAVDVEGSFEVRDVAKIATSPLPSNPTKVQTKPPSRSIGLGRESQLQELWHKRQLLLQRRTHNRFQEDTK